MSRRVSLLLLTVTVALGLAEGASPTRLRQEGFSPASGGQDSAQLSLVVEEIGPMGTGSNMFRCGLVHSSGVIYIGTYGPKPAIIWKYDPKVGKLEKVGAPGEYQLDCMVEAPNGMIYIGTAYKGLVYKLNPETGCVTTLGSPPIDSTSWIFTMIRTSKGEIYGAKGVGLFKLNWQDDTLEPIGLVPGNHKTLGPNPSCPITRQLEEAPDGRIWGDTNRWLFRFDPATGQIEPLVDMVEVDKACYGLWIPRQLAPTPDCYFAIFSRFGGGSVENTFYVYRAGQNKLKALKIRGFSGTHRFILNWLIQDGKAYMTAPVWFEQQQIGRLAVIDPFEQELVEYWDYDAPCASAVKLPGSDRYFMSGNILRVVPQQRRLETLAVNPISVECRCLAVSPQRRLGTNTYDCGHVFTLNLTDGATRDHGMVWLDEHRCNYGPAAFAGKDGRYFLANHGEGLPALWVTDIVTNKHWSVGQPAIQLVPFSDGTVWATLGVNLSDTVFDLDKCWIPARQSRPGCLIKYSPGAQQFDRIEGFANAGPIAEAPGGRGHPLIATGSRLVVFDPGQTANIAELPIRSEAFAAAHDNKRTRAYILLKDNSLWQVRQDKPSGRFRVENLSDEFSEILPDRGFFVLPQSNRLVAVDSEGTVTVYNPEQGKVHQLQGPVPAPAGPAVDVAEDAWYYAHRKVVKYALTMGNKCN